MTFWNEYFLQSRWFKLASVPPETYVCGFFGDRVAPKEGYKAIQLVAGKDGKPSGYIRICSGCNMPTVFTVSGEHFPVSAPGNPVSNVPEELGSLYDEARQSTTVGAFTAAVLVCRKMLMNIAVAEGAEEGKRFIEYVQYLADQGYVPPRGEAWVDYIRTRGNEANHEIALMSEDDAIALVTFVEMLLRFIYEFPNMIPSDGEVS